MTNKTHTETSAVKVARKYEAWSTYKGGKLYMIINKETEKPLTNIAFTYREIYNFRRELCSPNWKFEAVK
jgi:GH18 family chitinase